MNINFQITQSATIAVGEKMNAPPPPPPPPPIRD